MIINIIKYLFLFASGAMIGWCIELVFRRFFGKARKWINPGFLSGPYLPIYGTGVVVMYIICEFSMPLYAKLLTIFVTMTLVELVTGLFFLNKYNIRLWDYSKRFMNYKGVVCPLFSLFWALLGVFFYFVIYPYFYSKITMIYNHLELSLFIGVFYGVFMVDLASRIGLANRIKKVVESAEKEMPIHFENLKREINQRREKIANLPRPNLFNTFRDINLQDYIPNIKSLNRNDKTQDKKDDIA